MCFFKCVLTITLLFSIPTLANDGGIYYLDVNNLKVKKDEDPATNPVVIEFEGSELIKLKNLLPPTLSVEPQAVKNFSQLALIDGKKNRSLTLSCSTAAYNGDGDNGPLFVPFKDGNVKCSVSLSVSGNETSIYEFFGDPTPWEGPACIEKPVNSIKSECLDDAGNDVMSEPEVFQELIAKKETCYEAAKLAKACNYGSSLDVSTVGAANNVCEKELTKNKASKALRDQLAKMNEQCNKKYEKEEGTMYLSFNAHCQLAAMEWIVGLSESN